MNPIQRMKVFKIVKVIKQSIVLNKMIKQSIVLKKIIKLKQMIKKLTSLTKTSLFHNKYNKP